MAPKPTPAAGRQKPAAPPSDAALALALIRTKSQDPAVRKAKARLQHPGALFPDALLTISETLRGAKKTPKDDKGHE